MSFVLLLFDKDNDEDLDAAFGPFPTREEADAFSENCPALALADGEGRIECTMALNDPADFEVPCAQQ